MSEVAAAGFSSFSIFKYVGYFYLFWVVLSGVIFGLFYGLQTGDYNPLLANTGGVVCASDNQLYTFIQQYMMHAPIPGGVDANLSYNNFLLDGILKYLIVIGIVMYFTTRLWMFILHSFAGDDFKFFAVVFAIMTLALAEMLYVGFTTKELIIPFRGVGSFFMHFFDFFTFSKPQIMQAMNVTS